MKLTYMSLIKKCHIMYNNATCLFGITAHQNILFPIHNCKVATLICITTYVTLPAIITFLLKIMFIICHLPWPMCVFWLSYICILAGLVVYGLLPDLHMAPAVVFSQVLTLCSMSRTSQTSIMLMRVHSPYASSSIPPAVMCWNTGQTDLHQIAMHNTWRTKHKTLKQLQVKEATGWREREERERECFNSALKSNAFLSCRFNRLR